MVVHFFIRITNNFGLKITRFYSIIDMVIKMNIKAVILDLDGTLLDTITDIRNSLNEALELEGFDVRYTDQDVKYFIGSGITYTVECALKPFGKKEEDVEKVRGHYLRIYKKKQYDVTAPFLGIVELLKELKARGIFVGILSNKFHRDTITLANRYFSKDTFDIMIGQRDGIPVKPDPNGMIEILNTLDVKAEEVLYIGDTDVDMYTAKNAGVYGVGAVWGFRTEEELANAGADFLAKHPLEILQIIDEA